MYITKVIIENFKRFKVKFELDLNNNVNIIVGDNEVGKSSIIEAINLALTGIYHGKYVRNDISQHLFNNQCVSEYISSIAEGSPISPPKMRIELYFDECPELKGNHNSMMQDQSGLYFELSFDEHYSKEYDQLVKTKNILALPVEYYHVVWRSFHRVDITARSIPFKSAFIDTATQYQNIADMCVAHIIKNKLDPTEKIEITRAYRQAQCDFMKTTIVSSINDKLNGDNNSTDDKKLTLELDISSKRTWEDSLTAFIDEVPFHNIGKGFQCIVKTELALSKNEQENEGIVLIEEPENHLSFVKLNKLLSVIKDRVGTQQVVITTHSSFVSNKLGLKSLTLLSDNNKTRMTNISPDTQTYFEKLAGYDTLRFILSEKTILVEGDSDELVVQKAYLDKNGKLPIEDGIDVMCIRGLSFKRYLELAQQLKHRVAVVTDNDGNVEALKEKYKDYLGVNLNDFIHICFDETVDDAKTFGLDDNNSLGDKFNFNTLEPKILKENGLNSLKKIFGNSLDTNEKMLKHLHSNKSDSALAIFKTEEKILFPKYIRDAIEL